MKQFDVVIIGGGMVGASLALALLSYASTITPLRVALIDKGTLKPTPIKATAPFSPRVSALTEASVNLFKNIGIWLDIKSQRVSAYSKMNVWDSDGTGNIQFNASQLAMDNIGHIVENNVIRDALLSKLQKTEITLYPFETDLLFQLDHSQNIVTLTHGETLQSRLLVAADGAESHLRKAADIPISQKNYLHHAIVTTVKTEHHHQDTAWQVFLNSGPLAFLPLPSINGKHHCSIVWSLAPDHAERTMALDSYMFCNAISSAFEQRLGKVISTEERFCFPLCERHAMNYFHNNVVLVGDAAHTIHPLAGQGVNLGLMDIAVLTEELKRAIHRHDDIAGNHILSRYQRRRKGHNLLMIEAMNIFQTLFAADNIGIRWLRNTGMNTIDQLLWVKESIIRQALGITGDLPELMQAN